MGGWCFEDDMRMGMSVGGMACDCGPEIANAAFPVKVYLPVMEGSCVSRTRSFIRFSELKSLSLSYDKMASHMMPHVH
jgi:hypothetical protein